MKCPRCGLIVTDRVPKCRGCGFSIHDLDRRLRRVPERVGFVNDFAGVLSAQGKARIDARLAQFHGACGGDLALVTVDSTHPVKPSEYAFWLFNRWQVGGEAHAGLLILLAQKERRIECEVGYVWESIISDAASGAVLHEHVVPLLEEGKLDEALLTGVDRLADILERAVRPPEGGEV
jgi:uncharacterized protein